jgi:hypothetical protein
MKAAMNRFHTKLLMLSSAIFMLALGLIATFAPEKFSGQAPAGSLAALAVQAAGALYLGFAILNWMAKDNAIGGIYSRPVALGNLLHFFAVAMTLLRVVAAGNRQGPILASTALYLIFAVWFGLVVFGRSPIST